MAQQTIDIGAVANDGTGDPLREAFGKCNDNFTELYTGRSYVLGKSATGPSHTGNTTETTLATITVPAGAMGPNGQIEIEALWTITGSVNAKTLRARLGGLAGTAYLAAVTSVAANIVAQTHTRIANRNNAASQVAYPAASATGFGLTTVPVTTGAINTALAQDIVLTAQLANAGESITLDSYLVRITYGA